MPEAVAWQDSCSRPFFMLSRRGSSRGSSRAAPRKKRVKAEAQKRKRRKRQRLSMVDAKGKWWTLPRPKPPILDPLPPKSPPPIPQSLPLSLTTTQLSYQPQLHIFNETELQELKGEARQWKEKFQVAEVARVSLLQEYSRLQQEMFNWAEKLDQGQARIEELETELEGFRQEAHGEVLAPESVPDLQDVLSAVQRLQDKFR